MPQPTPTEEQELAALVDGQLEPGRRAELEARAQTDPDFAAALARQRAAVAMIARAADEVSAPMSLRAEIERMATPKERRKRTFRWLGPALAAGVAALAAVVVLTGANAPSVGEVVAAAARPPVAAISPLPGQPKLLDAEVDDVPFPNFEEKFGYEADGTRTDEFDGRDTETVFYKGDEGTAAYTIVEGDALADPDDATTDTREGTTLKSFTRDGRTVVTWERNGHTCVLSSTDVPRDTLLDLAGWHGKGEVPF